MIEAVSVAESAVLEVSAGHTEVMLRMGLVYVGRVIRVRFEVWCHWFTINYVDASVLE